MAITPPNSLRSFIGPPANLIMFPKNGIQEEILVTWRFESIINLICTKT